MKRDRTQSEPAETPASHPPSASRGTGEKPLNTPHCALFNLHGGSGQHSGVTKCCPHPQIVIMASQSTLLAKAKRSDGVIFTFHPDYLSYRR